MFRTVLGQLGDGQRRAVRGDAADRITVPSLVVVNSADDACPPSHQRAFFDALVNAERQWHEIKGANHYFSGGGEQREYLDEAADTVLEWAGSHQLLD